MLIKFNLCLLIQQSLMKFLTMIGLIINKVITKVSQLQRRQKKISTIHEFFYKQSDVKVGGSDNHIQTNLEKKSSTKIIISSLQNSDEHLFSTVKEKYSYSKIPTKLKSINKRYCDGKAYDRNLSNKKFFNLKSYLLDLKSVFYKIIFRKKSN